MDAIKTTSLTKYYGKSRGIASLDLTVAKGDFFGFIGPNGAGKSTTIRILMGLISPTGGRAEIFGKTIGPKNHALLSKIGYMPSEAAFYPNRRVREILKLSADLRRQDCSQEAALLCERLTLDTGKRISELSLGNRKKVSIVCALQHRPSLCILDEPTSGLDPLMQREFYEILMERHREGATIFLSSHVLSEVQRYCKHAAVIREGRLLACDSIEALGHTDAKRVTIRGEGGAGAALARQLWEAAPFAPEQIRDVQVLEDAVSFLYSGKPKPLLKALALLPLADVSMGEPDLEEIFMHYYTAPGQDMGAGPTDKEEF